MHAAAATQQLCSNNPAGPVPIGLRVHAHDSEAMRRLVATQCSTRFLKSTSAQAAKMMSTSSPVSCDG